MTVKAIIVIAICLALIALGIVIFVRTIMRELKGKCCGDCKGCRRSAYCDLDDKDKREKK